MLYYTVLYPTILYCTLLYCIILYYTILCCTILYYTVLYYTILYYVILYKSHACPGSYRPWGGLRPPLHVPCILYTQNGRFGMHRAFCAYGMLLTEARGRAAGELIPSELYHRGRMSKLVKLVRLSKTL